MSRGCILSVPLPPVQNEIFLPLLPRCQNVKIQAKMVTITTKVVIGWAGFVFISRFIFDLHALLVNSVP